MKKKQSVLRSGIPASRGVYNRGVRATVLFMRIVSETYFTWKKRGGITSMDKLELEVVFNCCKKILLQHFKVPEKKITEIWKTFEPKYVMREANKLFAEMSRKIITPDGKRVGEGIILPGPGKDLKKIAEEVISGRKTG